MTDGQIELWSVVFGGALLIVSLIGLAGLFGKGKLDKAVCIVTLALAGIVLGLLFARGI